MSEKISSARENMLNSQIYTNKVDDEFVLAAIEAVPRENFVPENLRGVAYVDKDLPLGDGRILMEPMVFARLLQLAEIKETEKVLVVASATGYAVAVIAGMAAEVVGCENNLNFITAAQGNLKNLGIANAAFVKAELPLGAERHKPFDVIFINGAVEEIPLKILAQLSENGRLVTVKASLEQPHGPHYGSLVHYRNKVVSLTKEFQAFTAKLPEFNARRGFEF